MVGAGSVAVTCRMACSWGGQESSACVVCNGLVDGIGGGRAPRDWEGVTCVCLTWHTLAKCPVLLQWWQVWLYAGQHAQPPICGLALYPGQIAGSCVVDGCLRCLTIKTAPAVWSLISLRCFFAASCALHRVMAASSVRSGCFSNCSTVSVVPSMIWSCMFFLCARVWTEVTCLRRVTKKSLKLSLGCCIRLHIWVDGRACHQLSVQTLVYNEYSMFNSVIYAHMSVLWNHNYTTKYQIR